MTTRRDFTRDQAGLFHGCLPHGHAGLARRVADWLQARGDNRQVRIALEELDGPRKTPASAPVRGGSVPA
ncbi:MAG: hypothetical protein LPJ95_07520 [Paracoccaceae bacterium]|nr:hypothetical protein [Paracoccaceae bacterium]